MSVEFEGNKACIAPEGVFIIGTYDEKGVPNAMNAAWGAQSDYGEITFFLAKHKTTDNIKHTKPLPSPLLPRILSILPIILA